MMVSIWLSEVNVAYKKFVGGIFRLSMTGWTTNVCSIIGPGNASLYCRLGWMVMETDRVTVEAVSAFAVSW